MTVPKEKTRSSTGIPERAMEQGAVSRQATNSNSDFTMRRKAEQEGISCLLSFGSENALTLQELTAVTGLDGRTIRLRIEAERRAGARIVSASDEVRGYFLADNPEDLRRFSRSMFDRAARISEIAQLAAEAAAVMEEQEAGE